MAAPWPVLVFDIETVPDIAGLRLLRGADAALSDAEVHAMELAERAEAGRSNFLPHYLQRVIVISCVFRDADGLRVHSFVDHAPHGVSEEGRIVGQFFKTIDKKVPQLVSWNGSGFDLPVLHYRGLKHGVVAGKYWELGDDDRDYRHNNYINRYHQRHIDLMDLLALYQPRANAPLDAMAKLCGFPGKLGMDGSQVHAAFCDGKLEDIRRYCETDVMNTYLLYCRFQKMRCCLNEDEYDDEIVRVREALASLAEAEPHWREYLDAWSDRTG